MYNGLTLCECCAYKGRVSLMCLHKQHQKHYFICKPQYQIFDILIGSLSNWSAQVDSFYSGGGGDTLLTVTDWRIKKKNHFIM